eukprot:8243985-Ditylum_brightwellii.AAC.1
MLNTAEGKLKPSEEDAEERMQFFTYSVHPRFETLVATSVAARLFLATLYMATASLSPDKSIGMTGEAKAIELTRQCVTNRAMSDVEQFCLSNLKEISKHRSPTLYLLCHDTEQSSIDYSFLQGDNRGRNGKKIDDSTLWLADECTAYINKLRKPLNPRLCLTDEECQRSLGQHSLVKWKRSKRKIRKFIEIHCCPVTRQKLNDVYKIMSDLWSVHEQTSLKPFPLPDLNTTEIGQSLYSELQKSWNLHCTIGGLKTEMKSNTIAVLRRLKKDVHLYIKLVEEYVFGCLNKASQALQFYHLADIVPLVTKQDMSSIACHHKIKFLLSFHEDNLKENESFVQELVARRRWDVHKHPYWLVFEAEQGIRIRPEQYEVAHHLIHNNGSA